MRSIFMSFLLVLLAQGLTAQCRLVTLSGEVHSGQSWSQPIGQGWLVRLVPVGHGYSGWDIAIEPASAAGYPDALLVATPPYGSINEREIGTSYGVRAQDAIGWNPRSFRFLTDHAALTQARLLYAQVVSGADSAQGRSAAATLLALAAKAASGRITLLDASITPGTADPAPFAQAWALQAARMRHTELPAPDGRPSRSGALASIRFRIALRMPANWPTPASLPVRNGNCKD